MDAHGREAAAAAQGMADTYGCDYASRPIGEGMVVVGVDNGRPFVGVVEWVDGERVIVQIGHSWQPVACRDIHEVRGAE